MCRIHYGTRYCGGSYIESRPGSNQRDNRSTDERVECGSGECGYLRKCHVQGDIGMDKEKR